MPGESFYMSILLVRRQEKIQAHHDQIAMEYFQRQFGQSEDSDDDTYSYSDSDDDTISDTISDTTSDTSSDDSDYSASDTSSDDGDDGDDDSTDEDDVWQKHIHYIQYIHEAIKMEWMAQAWFIRLEKRFNYSEFHKRLRHFDKNCIAP
jgi:hypothetical protein